MTCKVVAFANGGKCGSTTLAMLLKHRYPDYEAYDPASAFEDSPKEVCGHEYTCRLRPFYLDACPKVMTDERMKRLYRYDPNASIVVFVRPQHMSLLSLYNDKASSGVHSEDSDAWVLRNRNNQAYNYTDTFLRSSHVFRNIIVVETQDLRSDEGTARVLSKIAETRGFPPLRSRSIVSNPSLVDNRHTQSFLTQTTVDTIKKHWMSTNTVLCRLVQLRHFDCDANTHRVEL